MQNLKKGLSEVVTSVLLITVAILAVTIIAAVVKNTAKQVDFSPDKLCIYDYNPLKIKSACYNQETSDLQVTILRNNIQQLEIKEFSFLVNSGQDSSEYKCGCNSCKILASGEKTYFISQSVKPEKVSIKFNSCLLETKKIDDC